MKLKAFVFLVCAFFTCSLHAEKSFLTDNIDIPLINGLKLNPMEQMDFDTPRGQVLVLEGVVKNKTGKDVLSFYDEVLPQMGWVKVETGSFVRQEDSLTILVLKNKNPAKIRFDISLVGKN